jgi:hypothetical protein
VKRLTQDMFHDRVFHEGMRELMFLVGLAAAIVLLHRLLYHGIGF